MSGRRRRRNSSSGRRVVSAAAGGGTTAPGGYGGAYVVMSPASDVSLESMGTGGQVVSGGGAVGLDPSNGTSVASSLSQANHEFLPQQAAMYQATAPGYPHSMNLAYEQYGLTDAGYGMTNHHHAEMAQYFMPSPHPQGMVGVSHGMMPASASLYQLPESTNESNTAVLMSSELASMHPAAPAAIPVSHIETSCHTDQSHTPVAIMTPTNTHRDVLSEAVHQLTSIPPQPPLVLVQTDEVLPNKDMSPCQPSPSNSPSLPTIHNNNNVTAPSSPVSPAAVAEQPPASPAQPKLPPSPMATATELAHT